MSSPLLSRWRFASLALFSIALLAIPVIGALGSRGSKQPLASPVPRTGLVLFRSGSSCMEQDFLGTLPLGQVRVVAVASLDGDLPRRFHVSATPTLLRL